VVVFHAFPDVLPGGFVGVDIFFVISGYLISGIMFRELQQGTFSFSNFYARRIKRIFPALLLVISATFFVAWFVFFKDELRQLGGHMVRAAVFLSNFLLWKEAGYFDVAAETKPLLHLWSLAIEEQFYIIWPMLVWAGWKTKVSRWYLIGILFLASFFWNLYQSKHNLTHDFYSPLTRFWELLLGALLAWLEFSSSRILINLRSMARFLSFLGAALLFTSLLLIDSRKDFPGAWALLPVIATGLVISSGATAPINHLLLSNRLFVKLGLISFPLYLWHWPLLSIGRIIEGEVPSFSFRLFAVFLSIGLAWLTFEFFEKPVRYYWKSRFKVFALVAGMFTVGLLGYIAHSADGYPAREIIKNQKEINFGDIGHDEFHQYFKEHFYPCSDAAIQSNAPEWRGMIRCFQSKENSPVDVVMIGDSHSEHLFLGIAEQLPSLNVAYYLKMALPFVSTKDYEQIFNHILSDKGISTVILAAQWESKLGRSQQKFLIKELDTTVKVLMKSGKAVYVADDVMKFDFDPQRCKYQRPFTSNIKCEASVDFFDQQYYAYGQSLRETQELNPGLKIFAFRDFLCKGSKCRMAVDGNILYRDNNHLNIIGSKFIGMKILEQHPQLGLTQRSK